MFFVETRFTLQQGPQLGPATSPPGDSDEARTQACMMYKAAGQRGDSDGKVSALEASGGSGRTARRR